MRGCFVHREHRRPGEKLEQRPGNGDALSFAAGQTVPTLSDRSIQPFGQRVDQIQRAGKSQRLNNLRLSSLGVPIEDIFPYGSLKNVPLLADYTNR